MLHERFDRERIERVARIYKSNRDAGLALGVAPGSFGRHCRRYGIETPQARKCDPGRVPETKSQGSIRALDSS